ncbi:MAG: type II secretion system protein [Cyanobacteria bacterium P01_G01_bin.49]
MTLLEISVVAIIAGVLAAIATPSMMGILQGQQVNKGLTQIQSTLQTAQQQAMRNSKQCQIILNTTANPPHLSSPNPGCLTSSKIELPGSVAMKTNITDNNLTFSFKGTLGDPGGTIVVEPKQGRGEKKCLVIARGLGIMRTGIYTGDTTSSVSATNCTTSK